MPNKNEAGVEQSAAAELGSGIPTVEPGYPVRNCPITKRKREETEGSSESEHESGGKKGDDDSDEDSDGDDEDSEDDSETPDDEEAEDNLLNEDDDVDDNEAVDDAGGERHNDGNDAKDDGNYDANPDESDIEIVVDSLELESVSFIESTIYTNCQRFVRTSLGHTCVRLLDELLCTAEKTASWCAKNPMNQICEMPPEPLWMVLPLVPLIYGITIYGSIVALLIGNGVVTMKQLIYFLQTRRRKLRYLRKTALAEHQTEQHASMQTPLVASSSVNTESPPMLPSTPKDELRRAARAIKACDKKYKHVSLTEKLDLLAAETADDGDNDDNDPDYPGFVRTLSKRKDGVKSKPKSDTNEAARKPQLLSEPNKLFAAAAVTGKDNATDVQHGRRSSNTSEPRRSSLAEPSRPVSFNQAVANIRFGTASRV